MTDNVNHPKHYTQHPSGVEVIQITEHMNFCLGNAIKYIMRADHKNNPIEDLQKAVWYLNREIARRSNDGKTKDDTPKNERYVGFPDGMSLPTIPEGYTKAIYRGNRWFAENVKFATYSEPDDVAWCHENYNKAHGSPDLHYCEFIK